MHRRVRRILAVAVVGASVAIPTTRPASALETTRVIDATGTIALRIPDDWRDVNVMAAMSDDGRMRGQIVATPDQLELQITGHVPLVWATVVPAPADPAIWLMHNTLHSRCVHGEPELFDNGKVLGTRETWTACGSRKSQLIQIAGRSKDNDRAGIVVQVMLPRADTALVDDIIDSVEILPGPTGPADSEASLDSVVLAGSPVDAFVVDAIPADVTRIVDASHGIAVSVPAEFTDTITMAGELNDDGSARPMVIAAPDLNDFFVDGDHGLVVRRLPPVDPAVLLTNAAYSFCDDSGFRTVSNGSYKGVVRMWVQCAGPVDRIAAVALVPADRSATVLLEVALPDNDLTALQVAIASIELL